MSTSSAISDTFDSSTNPPVYCSFRGFVADRDSSPPFQLLPRIHSNEFIRELFSPVAARNLYLGFSLVGRCGCGTLCRNSAKGAAVCHLLLHGPGRKELNRG